MNQNDITTLILTYNEEIHLERCILNAKRFSKEIIILDSYSSDQTIEIAKKYGVTIYQHTYVNQSQQVIWGLENIQYHTEWVFKLDADEYLTDELIEEIKQKLPNLPQNVNGLTAPRKIMFLGRYIKHGILPMNILRLFKPRYTTCENRAMDEHIQITEGDIYDLSNPFYDDNKKGLAWWTQKHNEYSDREALDLLMTEYNLLPQEACSNAGSNTHSIREKKLRYIKLPLFWRAFLFFCYRYFFRLGFLDGIEGFLWHFLQGFWYRALADAKVYELKKKFQYDDSKIKDYLKTRNL